MVYISSSESETEEIAYKLAQSAPNEPSRLYSLQGSLGAGKTVFARGFARGLGYTGRVTSPTFCIVNEYIGGRLIMYHFDAYRVDSAGMLDIGFDDYLFASNSVCLIEWAENIANLIPENAVKIKLDIIGDKRRVSISY